MKAILLTKQSSFSRWSAPEVPNWAVVSAILRQQGCCKLTSIFTTKILRLKKPAQTWLKYV